MKNISILLRASVVLTGFCVAACATPTLKDPAFTEDYRVRHPINVAPKMHTLRIPYGGPGAGMDPNMSAQLKYFVDEYMLNGAGAISVSTPEGWEHVSLEFAGEIASLGVPRDRILLGTDPTPQYGAEIEIGYIGYIAQTQPCGDWSEDLNFTLNNTPRPDIGCSTQQNIAAMVADPRDLLGPRPMDAPDTQRRLTVLERYRAGLATPAERNEMQSGVVSQAVGN
ncbi:MAG: hypothetical protein RJB62_413 [Pseudomonadota bacterium]|jgi:pilus assembly protein CpaD